MGSDQERLVAIVYTEAEDRKVPFSLDDLAAKLNTIDTKVRKDDLELAIKQLCMIGVLTATRDGWIFTQYLHNQPATTQISRRTGDSVTKAQIQITETSSASSITSYNCEEESFEEISCKLRKIVQVLKESTTPLKGKEIAQRCKIGTTKSDVNRFLYSLQTKGILVNTNSFWSCLREPESDELTVYAAELAERKPGKKQQAKTGKSPECEYGCEKKDGNCYHFKQENHYHQHVAQFGDGNTVEFNSHGDDKLKK